MAHYTITHNGVTVGVVGSFTLNTPPTPYQDVYSLGNAYPVYRQYGRKPDIEIRFGQIILAGVGYGDVYDTRDYLLLKDGVVTNGFRISSVARCTFNGDRAFLEDVVAHICDCRHCRRPIYEHAAGKCLFEPTYYAIWRKAPHAILRPAPHRLHADPGGTAAPGDPLRHLLRRRRQAQRLRRQEPHRLQPGARQEAAGGLPDRRWRCAMRRCTNCRRKYAEHALWKCLFEPTTYAEASVAEDTRYLAEELHVKWIAVFPEAAAQMRQTTYVDTFYGRHAVIQDRPV